MSPTECVSENMDEVNEHVSTDVSGSVSVVTSSGDHVVVVGADALEPLSGTTSLVPL
jgi:hypothetical protein